MKEISLSISASAVAWYGAIVATIGTSVQFFNFLRDRKSAKITYYRGMKVVGRQGYPHDRKYTIVTVANTGRRPFTITHICMWYTDGEAAVFTDIKPPLPHGISEGQHIQAIVDESDMRFEKALWFEAIDATGTFYRERVAPWYECYWFRFSRWLKRLLRRKID